MPNEFEYEDALDAGDAEEAERQLIDAGMLVPIVAPLCEVALAAMKAKRVAEAAFIEAAAQSERFRQVGVEAQAQNRLKREEWDKERVELEAALASAKADTERMEWYFAQKIPLAQLLVSVLQDRERRLGLEEWRAAVDAARAKSASKYGESLPCGHPATEQGVCGIPWCKPESFLAGQPVICPKCGAVGYHSPGCTA